MLENFLGFAPKQVVVASIVSEVNDYADEIANMLKKQGIRAEVDLRNEKIGYKVREHSTKKVPFIFAIETTKKLKEVYPSDKLKHRY